MPKSGLRDSLLNMLGEFVAMNKTPDFKLSTQSNQYLDEAIQDEIEYNKIMSTNSLFLSQSQQQPRHFRTTSTKSDYRGSAATAKANSLPEDEAYAVSGRRQSLPVYVGDKRSFFQRLRRPSSRRQGSYEEARHEPHQANFHTIQQKRRRNSIISESDESYETDEEKGKNVPPTTTITVRQTSKNDGSSFENHLHRYSTNLKIR